MQQHPAHKCRPAALRLLPLSSMHKPTGNTHRMPLVARRTTADNGQETL